MNRYILRHLGGRELLRNLAVLAARGRGTTADMLAHLAEVEARQLYREAAHPSLFSYCVRGLRLSGSLASKMIATVRAAREFPAICELLAAGRLHLSSVVVLAPHLAADTAGDLLAESAGRTRAEIEVIIARRKRRHLPLVDFAAPARGTVAGRGGPAPAGTGPAHPLPQRADGALRTGERSAPPSLPGPSAAGSSARAWSAPASETAAKEVGSEMPGSGAPGSGGPGSSAGGFDAGARWVGANGPHSPGNVESRGAVRPDERSILRIAARPSLHEKLLRARILLGHEVRSGDPADIVEKALDEMIARLERRARPAPSTTAAATPRSPLDRSRRRPALEPPAAGTARQATTPLAPFDTPPSPPGHEAPAPPLGGDARLAAGKPMAAGGQKAASAANLDSRPAVRLDRGRRHIPHAVKAQVWKRDGGRCTYHSAAGQRCPAVTRLEFDHVVPVARGGASTAANLRLRCRAHNQLAAENAFGAGFMSQRRAAARGQPPAIGSGPGRAPSAAPSGASPRPPPT